MCVRRMAREVTCYAQMPKPSKMEGFGVEQKRFELSTSALRTRRSSQLSYCPKGGKYPK